MISLELVLTLSNPVTLVNGFCHESRRFTAPRLVVTSQAHRKITNNFPVFHHIVAAAWYPSSSGPQLEETMD